jgi:DNA-binding transcriptional ArsR family regulator
VKTGPDIAQVAALLGDPARANMMTALLDGVALSAGELAREAGVTAQTASSHLAKLAHGGLVSARKQGRHSYYALSGDDVGQVMEALMALAARNGLRRTRPGPRDPELRRARVCYDHLAGELGVAMLEGLVARGRLTRDGEALALTAEGEDFLSGLGLDLAGLNASRRPLCRSCLDWSVRRAHLAGGLGAALLARIYQLGWARRIAGSRLVSFTPEGLAAFERTFGAG